MIDVKFQLTSRLAFTLAHFLSCTVFSLRLSLSLTHTFSKQLSHHNKMSLSQMLVFLGGSRERDSA